MSVLDDVIECYVENQLVLGWEKERPISGFDERSEFPGTKVGELLYLWDEDGLSSFVIVGKEGDYAVIVNHGTKYN